MEGPKENNPCTYLNIHCLGQVEVVRSDQQAVLDGVPRGDRTLSGTWGRAGWPWGEV